MRYATLDVKIYVVSCATALPRVPPSVALISLLAVGEHDVTSVGDLIVNRRESVRSRRVFLSHASANQLTPGSHPISQSIMLSSCSEI